MRYPLLIALLLLVSASLAHAGQWELTTPMPIARYGHDAALGPEGNIYVMGGLPANATHTKKLDFTRRIRDGYHSNLAFDPEIRSWHYHKAVPGYVDGADSFYLYRPDTQKDTCKIGYNTLELGWIGLHYRLSVNNTDILKVVCPESRLGEYMRLDKDKLRTSDFQRQGDGVAVVTAPDGRIWWIGGRGEAPCCGGHNEGEAVVLPYDPRGDAWPRTAPSEEVYHTDIPRMQERRMMHEAEVTRDDKVCVFGGWRYVPERPGPKEEFEKVVTNTVECYDPESGEWSYRTPMSSTRFWHATAPGPDGRIYVFGGATSIAKGRSEAFLNSTEVYDPRTDTWSSRSPMPEALATHAAVLGADDRIYILGGSGPAPQRDVYIYDPRKDTWQSGPSLNTPRAVLAAVATPEGKIYAIGGTSKGAYTMREKINTFLPDGLELDTGDVLSSVEVLDIND